MTVPKTLSIGQVATRTGVSVSAIRFYADEGLVTPERSAGGNRRFLRSDIRKISFIAIAQRLGFSLAEIRAQLQALPKGRAPTKRDWERISRNFGTVLDERIATLMRLREKLDGCIGCGCLSLESCALYNPKDVAAKRGVGARWVETADSALSDD